MSIENLADGSRAAPRLPRSGVQSIDRAMALLHCFTSQDGSLGLTRLTKLTGLSLSTTHRILTALERHGAVRRVNGRQYELGPLVLQLAARAASSSRLQSVALPVMQKLRDMTGETVALHLLLPNLTRTVLDQVESGQPLRRTYTEIGESIPLHQGAPGKLLLAFLPEEHRELVLSRPLAAATPSTPTASGDLRVELGLIRERGYSISMGERVRGICTVAAPVIRSSERVDACISVSGPETRLPETRLRALGELAIRAAREISRQLGGSLHEPSIGTALMQVTTGPSGEPDPVGTAQ